MGRGWRCSCTSLDTQSSPHNKSDLPPKSIVPRLRDPTVPVCRAAMEMQTQRTDLWAESGKERVGQVSSLETYTLPCVKLDSQWEFALRCRELKLVLCDHLEGWDGVGGGKEAQDGGGGKE